MDTSKILPVLPIRNAVIFPGMVASFLVKRPGSVEALKRVLQKQDGQEKDGQLLAVAQTDPRHDQPKSDDLHRVGTVVKIEQMTGSPEKGYQVVARGLYRFHVQSFKNEGAWLSADGSIWPDRHEDDTATIQVLFKSLKELALQVLELLPGETEGIGEVIRQIEDPVYLTHLTAHYLDVPIEVKQGILGETSVKARLLKLLELVQKRRDTLQLESEIQKKLSRNIGKSQREALLREQMRTIREELGEESSASDDYRAKVEKADLPEDVRKAAEAELRRLESSGPQAPDSHVIRNYLDWLCSLPWKKSSGETVDHLDLDRAREILDEEHYGLERIKKRILQHLAVVKLKGKTQGSILLFVGPPGVGKTSLGQSVAKAMGRKFVRASLGGMRDDAEIRGHRRTYVGALPGRILQSIKRAGENDPVFMLDEIDKLSHGFYGDPASAMLEVLDPEQNHTFTDHYLDLPFDLSNVFFIATANSLDTIPAPLLDRMEVIELSGYTQAEKLHIAKTHLFPKQLKAHGLKPEQVVIPDDVLVKMISSYTRESGVRELQRKIGSLLRAATEKVVRSRKEIEGEVASPVIVDLTWLDEVFGGERYAHELSAEKLEPGVATGLAWTPQGGDILFIEATQMPGKGGLMLTGQLGDVMKESAQIALSLVRSRLPFWAPSLHFDVTDVHIHVPAGAIPKDGPSAGITIFTALASLFAKRSVSPKIAMTGEVSLRGAVLPVGGIKEKMIAAHRAGIRTVILSKRNEKDLREVPQEVKDDLRFIFVENVSEVLKHALGIEPNQTFEGLARSDSSSGGMAATA
jgi:ATP-dependent Lon protease